MNRYAASLGFFVLVCSAFFNVSYAQTEIECDLNFKMYTSPSIAECIFTLDSERKLELGDMCENNNAISKSQIEQLLEQFLPDWIAMGEGKLSLTKNGNSLSGMLANQPIPAMEKKKGN